MYQPSPDELDVSLQAFEVADAEGKPVVASKFLGKVDRLWPWIASDSHIFSSAARSLSII